MTKRNPFAKDLPEMPHGLREGAASETDASARPIPPDALNGLTGAAYSDVIRREADEGIVSRLGRVIRAQVDVIAAKDATIERMGKVGVDTITQLTTERDEERATLARVEELAQSWRVGRGSAGWLALRAALANKEPRCTCAGVTSQTGVDQNDGPDKVWRCDECDLIWEPTL